MQARKVARRGSSGLALIGAGTVGWVALRFYVRSEVEKELRKSLTGQGAGVVTGVMALLGLDPHFPPPEVLAASMVPIWSTTMPKDALADILARGRSSVYWPAGYRSGGDLAKLEPVLLSLARGQLS